MKKRIAALILAMMMIFAATSLAFASDLEIVSISPADGKGGMQPQNMAVKIKFNEVMADEAKAAQNQNKFKITNSEGVEQPFTLIYTEKYPDELWLILDETLQSDSAYQVEVIEGVVSASGNTLSSGLVSNFKTRNTNTDSKISMLLMLVLMVVMFGATAKASKKAAEENDPKNANKASAENLNPYKLAKEKNISVDEAKKLVEAEKAKIAKRSAKEEEERIEREKIKAQIAKDIEEEVEIEEKAFLREEGIYRVAGPKSVKAAGGRIPRIVKQKGEQRRRYKAEQTKRATKNKKKR